MKKVFAAAAISAALLLFSACTETEERAELDTRAVAHGNYDAIFLAESAPAHAASPVGGLPRGQNVLVAYFSATGTTRMAAQRIATTLSVTLHGILPEIPYTAEDLDWRNSASRSMVEQGSASARPAIRGAPENMDGYDIVFLGYPIWRGIAPRVIYTFLESHDLSGRTIVPFSTSNTSGIDWSVMEIRSLLPDSYVLDGLNITRANLGRMDEMIADWLNGLMAAD